MKEFVLDSIMCFGAGAENAFIPPRNETDFASLEPSFSSSDIFWPNCSHWLNPIHLHRSPLKRDADELNECANYARSAWGACCNRNFVCVCACVCMHIRNFMLVHA